MRQIRQRVRNRRGATITLVAVGLGAILAMGAISVDLGMLLKMRNDAQRTADAAALAGASAYLTLAGVDARPVARDRAFEFASRNYVGNTYVDTTGQALTVKGNNWTITSKEATVEIAPGIWRVRVTIVRPVVSTLFARVLGIENVTIRAYAAAEATNAGGAKCVKPFALADAWGETGSDADGNKFWDGGEDWEFKLEDGDSYEPWDGNAFEEPGDPTETGFGSIYRNDNGQGYLRDFGRQLIIKPQNPQVDQVIRPGNFFAWDMPEDPTQGGCPGGGGGGGGGGNGAAAFEQNICSCNNQEVFLGTPYPVKNGNMKGPTEDGVTKLIGQDRDAYWDPTGGEDGKGTVKDSDWDDWRDSPRVIKVALYDPAELYKSGKINIKFNNIALMFLEKYTKGKHGADDFVTARFITFAEGSGNPGPGGPLAKVLRLVE